MILYHNDEHNHHVPDHIRIKTVDDGTSRRKNRTVKSSPSSATDVATTTGPTILECQHQCEPFPYPRQEADKLQDQRDWAAVDAEFDRNWPRA